MTNSNSDLWGALPKANIEVYRNVTFYEFQNPLDVIFRNKVPVFTERKGYSKNIINKNRFTDEVTCDRYTYFEEALDGFQDGLITTVNPGAFGVWQFVKKMTIDDAKLFSQEMRTGNNIDDTWKFISIQGFENARFNTSTFNGNETLHSWDNPWNMDEPVSSGSEGFMNSPFREKGDILSIFVPQIYKSMKFTSVKGPNNFDFETLRYELDPNQYPANDSYTSRYSGTHNLTKPYQAPINYCDKDIAQAVRFEDSDGNVVEQNEYDRTYQTVEPYSGVPLEAVIQLMITISMEKDELFPTYPKALLPVSTLWISGNFTQEAADSQFGELWLGLKVIPIAKILGIVLGCLLIIIAIFILSRAFYLQRKQKRDALQIQKVAKHGDLSSTNTQDV